MLEINSKLSFAKKRLDLNALYNDESLFSFFEYDSSFQDKLKQKDENDYVYNTTFNDKDATQFRCFENINEFNKIKKIKINFGKDPYNVNNNLKKKNNMKNMNEELKYKMIKYWSSVNNFHLFKYKENDFKDNDIVNSSKILDVDWKRKIPYLLGSEYSNLFVDKCRFLLRKTIMPTKYINHISVIIKDNRLLKKMIRKNRIIIMNDINIEHKLLRKIKITKKSLKK